VLALFFHRPGQPLVRLEYVAWKLNRPKQPLRLQGAGYYAGYRPFVHSANFYAPVQALLPAILLASAPRHRRSSGACADQEARDQAQA